MARRFISRFVLPLVKGGRLRLGRPVGWPALAGLLRRELRDGGLPTERQSREARALVEVARLRELQAGILGAAVHPLPLDEPSLRLAAAVHNLLLLGFPELVGSRRRQERVAELARDLADLGPPASLAEAVARYSLLGRLPETVRMEHQTSVGPRWWRFELRGVGGRPSFAMRALARLSAMPVESRPRAWWKEIGFPACADRAIAELFRACPLLEAMDPLRLHPPLSWRRILPVLRFPALGRVVAGRMLELGSESAGSALAAALLRFTSVDDEGTGPAHPTEIAFAVRFVAHVCWLDRLFGPAREPSIGSDLAALLAAAAEVEPRLLWPADLGPDTEPGAGFALGLQRLRAGTPASVPDRYRAMRSVCMLARGAV